MKETFKDPVCGTPLEASQAAGSSEFEGMTYYFCCAACQRDFDANARQFAAPEPRRAHVPCCGLGMVRHTVQRGSA